MSLFEKLAKVQGELKAPKNQRNNFGKYQYRSLEDINEAAKPVCGEYGLALGYSDEVTMVGDRIYVQATCFVVDVETGERHEVQAMAREPLNKKGMDESQITGAASSYARKYAANGMFALDDTKDADTDEYQQQGNNHANQQNTAFQFTQEWQDYAIGLFHQGATLQQAIDEIESQIKAPLANNHVKTLEALSKGQK